MTDQDRQGFLDVLGQDAHRRLREQAHTVAVRRGQAVLGRGEVSTDVFIVQEGRLEVVLYAASGREVSLRELGKGQMFGELAAIDGQARSVGIMALTDARLLSFPKKAFREAVFSGEPAQAWMMRRLAAQIRSLTDRVFELSALNVQARLHCELMRLARSLDAGQSGIEPAPTHAELANRIGSHREAVTRELKALADRRILRSGRRRLEFLDVERLEEVVQTSLRAPLGEIGWW
jgi:CRP-like cAMP-binding protein